jgi:hypothetical protein
MIKRSLFVAALLLLLHAVVVRVAPAHKPIIFQHQWQRNLIKAQRYVYGADGNAHNVIIGSSLSERLVTEKLPNTYNLAFTGLGLFDGLTVILRSKQVPRNVYVEMNLVLRGEDKQFKASLSQPILSRLRNWLPSLRDENEPVSLTMRFLNRLGIRLVVQHTPEDANLFTKLLAIQLANFSKTPEKALIKEQFGLLKNGVSELEKRGASVIFFEMPTNEKLSDLPQIRTIRESFYATFPPADYHYIARPQSERFVTTDGVHLTEEEAIRYTDYFKSQMMSGAQQPSGK